MLFFYFITDVRKEKEKEIVFLDALWYDFHNDLKKKGSHQSVKNKVVIVTDSNSGITQSEAKELGISVLSMPFYINEELFYEDITLSQEEFYEK